MFNCPSSTPQRCIYPSTIFRQTFKPMLNTRLLPWTLQHVTDAFHYLPGCFAQAGIMCSVDIVSIQAVPGFNVHSQVREWNNHSIALSAVDAAVIPKLVPTPMPADYSLKDVPAGADLSGSKSLELCAIQTQIFRIITQVLIWL